MRPSGLGGCTRGDRFQRTSRPASQLADVLSELTELFVSCQTLAAFMGWTSAQVPPVTIQTLVTQDELTHDCVAFLKDGLWLVPGLT